MSCEFIMLLSLSSSPVEQKQLFWEFCWKWHHIVWMENLCGRESYKNCRVTYIYMIMGDFNILEKVAFLSVRR